jgi:hypothetical protein
LALPRRDPARQKILHSSIPGLPSTLHGFGNKSAVCQTIRLLVVFALMTPPKRYSEHVLFLPERFVENKIFSCHGVHLSF